MSRGTGISTLVLLLTLVGLLGCQTTYYALWERLGKEKRHLFRENVQKASSEQQKASEEFKDALTRVREIYGFKGGDLEEFYTRLRDDYEDCEERAVSVRKRIETVERIAADLFKEWEDEINGMTSPNLKEKSRKSLNATKARYARLRTAMTGAEKKMDPVLRRLKDYVLFLKHNLNARALGALKKEVEGIESEVGTLVNEIAESVREADDFLKTLE